MSLYSINEQALNQCNIKGKILEIKKSVDDEGCSFNLFIKFQDDNSNIHFIKGNELIDLGEYGTSCIGGFTNYPIFLNGNEYYPKVGDSLNFIINNLNNNIIKTSFTYNEIINDCIFIDNETDFFNYNSLSDLEIINLKQKIIDKIIAQDLIDNEIINNIENDIKKEETIKTVVIDKKETNNFQKEDNILLEPNNFNNEFQENEDDSNNIEFNQITYKEDKIYILNNKDYFIIGTGIISLVILGIIIYKKFKKQLG